MIGEPASRASVCLVLDDPGTHLRQLTSFHVRQRSRFELTVKLFTSSEIR
jgi:hypothetical protein